MWFYYHSYPSQGCDTLSDSISGLSSRFQLNSVPNIHVSSINSSILGNTVYKDVETDNRTILVWSTSVCHSGACACVFALIYQSIVLLRYKIQSNLLVLSEKSIDYYRFAILFYPSRDRERGPSNYILVAETI